MVCSMAPDSWMILPVVPEGMKPFPVTVPAENYKYVSNKRNALNCMPDPRARRTLHARRGLSSHSDLGLATGRGYSHVGVSTRSKARRCNRCWRWAKSRGCNDDNKSKQLTLVLERNKSGAAWLKSRGRRKAMAEYSQQFGAGMERQPIKYHFPPQSLWKSKLMILSTTDIMAGKQELSGLLCKGNICIPRFLVEGARHCQADISGDRAERRLLASRWAVPTGQHRRLARIQETVLAWAPVGGKRCCYIAAAADKEWGEGWGSPGYNSTTVKNRAC